MPGSEPDPVFDPVFSFFCVVGTKSGGLRSPPYELSVVEAKTQYFHLFFEQANHPVRFARSYNLNTSHFSRIQLRRYEFLNLSL